MTWTWTPLTDEELDEIAEEGRRQYVLFRHVDDPSQEGAPGCWSGGEPTLPAEIPWPIREGAYAPDNLNIPGDGIPKIDYPYMFAFQVNCAEIPVLPDEPEGTPHEGTLFVFYDGLCGDVASEFASDLVHLIYVPEDCSSLPLRECPAMPTLTEDEISRNYPGVPRYGRVPFVPVLAYEFNANYEMANDPPEDLRQNEWKRYIARLKPLRSAERDRLQLDEETASHHRWLSTWLDDRNDGHISLLTIVSDFGPTPKLFGLIVSEFQNLEITVPLERLAQRKFNRLSIRSY